MLTIKSASEDVLAATVARNELRKQGIPVSHAQSEFLDAFHRLLFVPSSLSPKEAKVAEKARVATLEAYLASNPDLTLE